MKKNREAAFTLLELLIVIVILGILAALISGNFITSLKKGRDARRKGDLEQIQRALELFYDDVGSYPTTAQLTLGSDTQLCNPTLDCYSTTNTTGKTYMEKLPVDSGAVNYEYDTEATGQTYRLYACLENNQQVLATVSSSFSESFAEACKTNCFDSADSPVKCIYGVSSSNTTP